MRKMFKDDGKLIVAASEDVSPVLDHVRRARDGAYASPVADSWHIASVPTILIEKWLAEEGLQLSDREAVRDMMKRKLLSGEFDAFRVRQGTW